MVSSETLSVIHTLDLEPIKKSLMRRSAGKGWAQERADAAEREYRRFLCIVKMYADTPIVPLADVEQFWYQHIFDTKKYAADCQRAFGYFLHHFPYIGLRGNEDREALERIRARTEAIYEQTFGEACPSAAKRSGQEQRKACSAALRLSMAYGSPAGRAANTVCTELWAATGGDADGRAATAASANACCVAPPRRAATPGAIQAAECRAGFYLERPRPA
jgi:hypothetical protein